MLPNESFAHNDGPCALDEELGQALGAAPIQERRSKIGMQEKSFEEASTLTRPEQKKVHEWISAYVKTYAKADRRLSKQGWLLAACALNHREPSVLNWLRN